MCRQQIELLIYEDGHEDEWYAGFDVTGGFVYYKASEGPRGKARFYALATAAVASYYSVAVQMHEDKSFKVRSRALLLAPYLQQLNYGEQQDLPLLSITNIN